MSKCVYCHQRKGRRACPALAGLICSQCCGEHRLSRISCPPDCSYLDTGSEYQQRRLGEQFTPVRRDLYRQLSELGGEKAAALCNLIEVVTFTHFHDRRDGQDAEVIAAVQALRRTLSPLHVPAAPMPVFAERLKREYDTFVKQQPQQIVDNRTAPDILDRLLTVISEFSGREFQSRRFLHGLIGYVRTFHPDVAEHLAKQAEAGRIVLPSQFTPPPPETHVHSPECRHHH
ncbi:hypothetical protein [Nitrospira sp. Nam80]